MCLLVLVATPPLASAQTTGVETTQDEGKCIVNIIEQSKCVYEAILADIVQTYDAIGGGGITSIAQTATDAFTVSIAQEGRTDLVHYVVKVGEDGSVSILSRTEDVRTR